ncbi:MAG: hypothetical protein MUF23_00695 [Pirellula sp.]|nr:hypothetical protein [Pirellula sp.]
MASPEGEDTSMLTQKPKTYPTWLAGLVLALGMPSLVGAQDTELDPRNGQANPSFLGRFFNPPAPKRVETPPPREASGNGGLFLPLKSFSNAFRARPRDATPGLGSRVASRPPREPFAETELELELEGTDAAPVDAPSANPDAETEADSEKSMEIPPSFSKLNPPSSQPSRASSSSQPARLTLSGSKLGNSAAETAPPSSDRSVVPPSADTKIYEATPKTETLDSQGTSRRTKNQSVEPRMPKPTRPVTVPPSELPEAQATTAPPISPSTTSPRRSPLANSATPNAMADKRDSIGSKKVSSTVVSRSSLASPIEQAKLPTIGATAPSSSLNGLELQSPGLKLRLVGPDSILIDQAIPYEVVATNDGQTVLQGLTVRVRLPSHVAMIDPVASDGEAVAISDDQGNGVAWTLPRLAPGSSKSLRVMIRTEQPEHFALGLDWTIEQPSVQMPIRVQQPQLLLAVEGPSEADYGQPQVYRLRLRNPGNADARDVRVELQAESQATQESIVGDLAAGSERVLEMELTFEQAGQLAVHAKAISEASKLESASRVDVEVRQSQLLATWTGPSEFYQGNTADYLLTLENLGKTAAVKNVCVLNVPSEVELLALPTGIVRTGNQLQWEIPNLAIGEKKEWNFQCVMNQLGDNTFAFKVESSTGPDVESSIQTQVDAIADLQLLVNDPVAPAPIDKPVVYEVTVSNRGKKAAEDVYVIAQFSDGIEPSRIEGHTGQLVPGQVLFDTIPKIAPGEQIVLRITAQASKPGTHRFRAVVRCQGTEDDMLKEESTRYTSSGATRTDRR